MPVVTLYQILAVKYALLSDDLLPNSDVSLVLYLFRDQGHEERARLKSENHLGRQQSLQDLSQHQAARLQSETPGERQESLQDLSQCHAVNQTQGLQKRGQMISLKEK